MNKVTKEQIEEQIKTVKYTYDVGTTICVITLKSDWKAVGVSQCASQEWYDKELGEQIAYSRSLDKLFEQFTFSEYHK